MVTLFLTDEQMSVLSLVLIIFLSFIPKILNIYTYFCNDPKLAGLNSEPPYPLLCVLFQEVPTTGTLDSEIILDPSFSPTHITLSRVAAEYSAE